MSWLTRLVNSFNVFCAGDVTSMIYGVSPKITIYKVEEDPFTGFICRYVAELSYRGKIYEQEFDLDSRALHNHLGVQEYLREIIHVLVLMLAKHEVSQAQSARDPLKSDH